MKVSRILGITALVSGIIVTTSMAVRAEDGTAEKTKPAAASPRAARVDRLQHLSEALSLTDEQKTKLKPILTEETKKIRDLRADASLSRDDKSAKIREERESMRVRVKGVLTAEQAEKFAKLESERMERGKKKEKAQ